MIVRLRNIALLSLYVLSGIQSIAGKDHIVCEGEEFKPTCDDGQILVIESANYGRTNGQTCLKAGINSNHICKQKSTLSQLNRHCYGKQECNVTVVDEFFGNPCKAENVPKYLEVSYECVADTEVTEMCKKYKLELGDRSSGYIRSRNYPDPYPVKEDCILKLQAREGYRYRVKLLDLDVENRKGTGCYDWLVIKDEQSIAVHMNYCGELEDIHTSEPSSAENIQDLTVTFRSDALTNRGFRGYLIKYEEHPTILPKVEL